MWEIIRVRYYIFSSAVVLMVTIMCLSVSVYAQTPTDAGALMQQVEQERQKASSPPDTSAPTAESTPQQDLTQDQLKVTVTGFRFEGNTLLTSKELDAVVRKYLHHQMTYTELQNAAAAVGEAYRKKGWAVRSFLPKQDVVDGIVVIQIVEATFGKVHIEEGSYRWPTQHKIESMVAVQQQENKSLNTRKMERSLLVLDDLPGVTASGRLQEGELAGQTDLVIKTTKESLASGMVIADTEGSRSTGEERIHSFVQLSNPLGIADQSSAYLLYSEGLRFARLEETVPIGNNGWRVGANGSVISYEVLPSEFEALDAKGTSSSVGAQSIYPLMRTREKNLYFNLNYDRKYFKNKAQAATSSEYCVDNYTTTLRGNMVDKFIGGGNTSASVSLILGTLDLGTLHSGEDRNLEGDYQKMTYSIARQQTLIPKVSLYGGLSGQISSKTKLDSSEKFYLGGPNGVRAYPVSEGSGVEGYLSRNELRWRFLPNYQLSGFYDYGHVYNSGSIKSYSLQGAGTELVWQSKSGLSVKLTWAHRIGDNPNPTSSGDDQDGSLREDRFWLQISQRF